MRKSYRLGLGYKEALEVKKRVREWEENFGYINNDYDVDRFLDLFKNERQMKAFCKRCKFYILTSDSDYEYEDYLENEYKNIYDLLFMYGPYIAGKVRIQMPRTKTLMKGYRAKKQRHE